MSKPTGIVHLAKRGGDPDARADVAAVIDQLDNGPKMASGNAKPRINKTTLRFMRALLSNVVEQAVLHRNEPLSNDRQRQIVEDAVAQVDGAPEVVKQGVRWYAVDLLNTIVETGNAGHAREDARFGAVALADETPDTWEPKVDENEESVEDVLRRIDR